MRGSSPRARGTPLSHQIFDFLLRFIPAGAGNTNVCATLFVSSHGSSPRARGTHRHGKRILSAWRFIPAGAGNTQSARGRPCGRPVHPRGRGEHVSKKNFRKPPYGSSPRARGTQRMTMAKAVPTRFIPAGAGNTSAPARCCARGSVHPRGRGEHERNAIGRTLGHGSSPRARGTQFRVMCKRTDARFIPAGAGNTTARTIPL